MVSGSRYDFGPCQSRNIKRETCAITESKGGHPWTALSFLLFLSLVVLSRFSRIIGNSLDPVITLTVVCVCTNSRLNL